MNEQLLRALLALKDGNPTEWNRLVEQCVDINNRELTVCIVITLLLLTFISIFTFLRFFISEEKRVERGIDSELLEMLIVALATLSIFPLVGVAANYCDAAAPWVGLLTPVMKT